MTDFRDPPSAALVPSEERPGTLESYFSEWGSELESMVFLFMERLASNYRGAYWHFYRISNGGFYMAPDVSEDLAIRVSGNYFTGTLSPDAAGIVTTLFALNHLATKLSNPNDDDDGAADPFIECYHRLRDFARHHAEQTLIFDAID